MQPADPIVNISAYKFITLDDIVELRPRFLQRCTALELKGTILLAPEGINMFLAGSRAAIDSYMAWMHQDPRLS
ncbi:MAG: sulfurtransferase, partial [Burkholderiaceae bacterium]